MGLPVSWANTHLSSCHRLAAWCRSSFWACRCSSNARTSGGGMLTTRRPACDFGSTMIRPPPCRAGHSAARLRPHCAPGVQPWLRRRTRRRHRRRATTVAPSGLGGLTTRPVRCVHNGLAGDRRISHLLDSPSRHHQPAANADRRKLTLSDQPVQGHRSRVRRRRRFNTWLTDFDRLRSRTGRLIDLMALKGNPMLGKN
jgi:hypothetical protein